MLDGRERLVQLERQLKRRACLRRCRPDDGMDRLAARVAPARATGALVHRRGDGRRLSGRGAEYDIWRHYDSCIYCRE